MSDILSAIRHLVSFAPLLMEAAFIGGRGSGHFQELEWCFTFLSCLFFQTFKKTFISLETKTLEPMNSLLDAIYNQCLGS